MHTTKLTTTHVSFVPEQNTQLCHQNSSPTVTVTVFFFFVFNFFLFLSCIFFFLPSLPVSFSLSKWGRFHPRWPTVNHPATNFRNSPPCPIPPRLPCLSHPHFPCPHHLAFITSWLLVITRIAIENTKYSLILHAFRRERFVLTSEYRKNYPSIHWPIIYRFQ